MARFPIVGPSYSNQSVNADCQRCLNWIVENDESGDGKSPRQMFNAPGTARFCGVSDKPVRGELFHQATGRAFAVSGSSFYEIFADGTSKKWGAVANDGLPASLAQSNIQIMVASGQHGYCFTLATNIWTPDPANLVSPLIVQYLDGFFISLQANSNKFQYSDPLDGTTWQGLNTTAVSVFPDNVVSLLVDHREAFIFGATKTAVYYDSGNTFTFDVVPSGFIEQGGGASFCRNRIDNTLLWLGASERGKGGIAWKANGYQPTRVSNHAVETAWKSYATVADAVSYAWESGGHNFWQIYFPSANPKPGGGFYGATWVLDTATSLWFERCFLDVATGREYAHRSWCHMYAFGKHLVGDWNSGSIYWMDEQFLSDDCAADDPRGGTPIKRLRRATHISQEQERIYHGELQLDLETGLGPQPPFTTDGQVPAADGSNWRGPYISLRWSDDGGHTWSNYYPRDCGQAGAFKTRVRWLRLGQSRDRVYEISTTDPVPWRIIDAYLRATGYEKPVQRLADKLKQQA